jgi:adenosylcobinamide-GDP ribazoletransferase
VCSLVLKCAALASVPEALRWGIVFLAPQAGRCALVVQMAVLPYARREGGLASVFGRPRWTAVMAPAILAAVGWLALGSIGLAAAALSTTSTFAFSVWCRRKIDGFTGDTLGAACEIAEIVPVLVAASWRWPQ